MGVAENANALASTPEMFLTSLFRGSKRQRKTSRSHANSVLKPAGSLTKSVCPSPYFSAGHTKTLDGQRHVCRAHRDTQREPQYHSLEDLLVRSEESPCENTDAPRAPAKSSSQTPTEIVSPIVSPVSEAISQKLCFQPKSKAASAHNEADADKVSATPASSAGQQKRSTDNDMSVERIKSNESLRTTA